MTKHPKHHDLPPDELVCTVQAEPETESHVLKVKAAVDRLEDHLLKTVDLLTAHLKTGVNLKVDDIIHMLDDVQEVIHGCVNAWVETVEKHTVLKDIEYIQETTDNLVRLVVICILVCAKRRVQRDQKLPLDLQENLALMDFFLEHWSHQLHPIMDLQTQIGKVLPTVQTSAPGQEAKEISSNHDGGHESSETEKMTTLTREAMTGILGAYCHAATAANAMAVYNDRDRLMQLFGVHDSSRWHFHLDGLLNMLEEDYDFAVAAEKNIHGE